jgi:hypothetical protein
MDVPWEGGPLEVVIQQIEDAAEAFELGGTTLSDDHKRADKLHDLRLVSTSNLLSDACQCCQMLPGNQMSDMGLCPRPLANICEQPRLTLSAPTRSSKC